MSKPTTPSSRYLTDSSAISTERANCRMAVTIARIAMGFPARSAFAAPSVNPASHAFMTSSRPSPPWVDSSGA